MALKKNVLITGGAGFIGSHLVDLLIEKGFSVRVIDDLSGGHESNLNLHLNNPDLIFEKIDICNLKNDNLIFRDLDYVYHFAGKGDIVPSIENPDHYIQTNVIGTTKVLEASKQSNLKKFLYAASSSCYGLASTPTKEDHLITNMYPYALSKYMGELAVMHWNKVYGLNSNSIRIFNAYGPRVRTTGVYGAVFGVFLKQKLAGKPFTIVGDGDQKRDFLYVTDVVKAFYLSSISDYVGEVYNLGAGNPQTINSLVQIMGGDKIHIPKRPGEPDETNADITKIQNHLNWSPEVSFKEGVLNMLKEIDNWKNAPLWDENKIKEVTKTWFKYMDK